MELIYQNFRIRNPQSSYSFCGKVTNAIYNVNYNRFLLFWYWYFGFVLLTRSVFCDFFRFYSKHVFESLRFSRNFALHFTSRKSGRCVFIRKRLLLTLLSRIYEKTVNILIQLFNWKPQDDAGVNHLLGIDAAAFHCFKYPINFPMLHCTS